MAYYIATVQKKKTTKYNRVKRRWEIVFLTVPLRTLVDNTYTESAHARLVMQLLHAQ